MGTLLCESGKQLLNAVTDNLVDHRKVRGEHKDSNDDDDGGESGDGAIDLADGTELTTSGTLESDTNHLTLMVTSSSIHELALRTRTA